MPRISAALGPSSADVAKETATLVAQGKLENTHTKLIEWTLWKLG